MSYSALIPFDAHGEQGEYTEFRNAWGSGAFVWGAIQHRLGWRDDWYETNDREARSWFSRGSDPDDLRPLWDLWKNEALPWYERITLLWTFDHVWVPVECVPRVADALRAFHNAYGGDGWSHLPAVANAMEQQVDDGWSGFGFWQTSVTENPWSPWDPEEEAPAFVAPTIDGRIDYAVPDLFPDAMEGVAE